MTPPPPSSSSLPPLVPNPNLADLTLRDLFAIGVIVGQSMRETVTTADVLHAYDIADELLEARAGVLEDVLEGPDAETWATTTEIFGDAPPAGSGA